MSAVDAGARDARASERVFPVLDARGGRAGGCGVGVHTPCGVVSTLIYLNARCIGVTMSTGARPPARGPSSDGIFPPANLGRPFCDRPAARAVASNGRRPVPASALLEAPAHAKVSVVSSFASFWNRVRAISAPRASIARGGLRSARDYRQIKSTFSRSRFLAPTPSPLTTSRPSRTSRRLHASTYAQNGRQSHLQCVHRLNVAIARRLPTRSRARAPAPVPPRPRTAGRTNRTVRPRSALKCSPSPLASRPR
jgi:hypothetical protein